jgi:hypothetical protein
MIPTPDQFLKERESAERGLRALPLPNLSDEEIVHFIGSVKWTFAKSMPFIPHFYAVRQKCPDAHLFLRFAQHIRDHGYDQQFGKRMFRYFDWETDGVVHIYWTMDPDIYDTVIINRAVKKPPKEA